MWMEVEFLCGSQRGKGFEGRQGDAVPGSLQAGAKGDIWLHMATLSFTGLILVHPQLP